jgi:hypothetical protein
MKIQCIVLLAFLGACTPLAQSSVNSGSNPKVLVFKDFAYEPQIRTILLHQPTGNQESSLQPSITRMGNWNLMLQFDDINTQRENYNAKIIHCNFDWTKSQLLDLDFMDQYNEFPINNFEFSIDSHIPYVHYWINLPPVKLPGNYLLIVYRGSDKDDLILSKRFMIYDTQIGFEGERNLIGAGAISSANQQLNFTINYKNVDIVNPYESVNVVIRQNQRWDNIVSDIQPSFVRETEKQIEYRFFDEQKMFKGGSEFRFFDIRSLNNPGRNVDRVDRTVKPFEIYIEKDKSRSTEAYSQIRDYNGGFILDNYDYRSAAFSNYAYVNFTLVSKPIPGDVYVTGGFTYWNMEEENKMYYDSIKHEYQGRVILKQGWYDYQYVVKSKQLPLFHFEGTHFETENTYEIFVYYRPFQPKADLLLGYVNFGKNQR